MSAGPPGRQSLNGSQRCLLPVFMPLCNSLHLNGAGHTDLLLKNRIGKGDKIAHWDSAIKDGDLYLAHFLSDSSLSLCHVMRCPAERFTWQITERGPQSNCL